MLKVPPVERLLSLLEVGAAHAELVEFDQERVQALCSCSLLTPFVEGCCNDDDALNVDSCNGGDDLAPTRRLLGVPVKLGFLPDT